MRNKFGKSILLYLCVAFGGSLLATAAADVNSYEKRWSSFQTQLIRKEKSFQDADALNSLEYPYERIEYISDGMALQALLDIRNIEVGTRKPAVVYLHGGFALRKSELEFTLPFVDAGLVVLAPSWRGENGNPGYFECFFGEVRDAKAAIRWLADQDFVDPEQIYVFGWSVGGGIAMNLAMHDDIPIKLSGSSAGLYDLDLIESWATEDDFIRFPYDYQDEMENYYRLPLYHLQDMVRPHYSYVATDDDYALYRQSYNELYPGDDTSLRLIELPGNHVDSVPRAVQEFMALISEGM
jgi:dipeptidyl aminopeptidase/acylaminoacyl peptidase